MNTSSLRKQLHNYLEIADDKKIKAIYVMMEKDIKDAALEFSNELQSELDKRSLDLKNNKATVITAKESKRRINKILNTVRKK